MIAELCDFNVYSKEIKIVKDLLYLGSTITQNRHCREDLDLEEQL